MEFAGVTVINVSTGAVTVSVLVPMIGVPVVGVYVAVIVVLPATRPLASPAVLIDASVGTDEDHVTPLVRAVCVPLLRLPVTVYCRVKPAATEVALFTPATVIDVTVAAVTVSVEELLVTVPNIAVIVVLPAATPVATPVPAIVAPAVFDEAHVTLFVRFDVVLLL